MEDSQTTRLDEVEQELVHILSIRADDLQIFTSRQDQLLQSHYHSLNSVLQTARLHFDRLKIKPLPPDPQEIRERWVERQNLKLLWGYCEEQKQFLINNTNNNSNNIDTSTNNTNISNDQFTHKFQTPNQKMLNNNYFDFNNSNTSLSDLSLN